MPNFLSEITSSSNNSTRRLWAIFLIGQIFAVALARLALDEPKYAFGLIYVVVFWVVAWNRPAIALALVFAMAPFQQSLLPGSPVLFSLTEVNLGLMLPVLLLRCAVEKRALRFGPIAWPLALFFAVCLAASLASWRGRDSLVSLIQMGLYLVLCVVIFSSYARHEREFLPSLRGVLWVGVFFSLTMLALRTNYVLDLHKNGLGASVACAFLVGVELWFSGRDGRTRNWLLLVLAILLAGLLFSLSRGAWLGTMVGLSWILALRGQWKLAFRGALVFLPLLSVAWLSLPQTEREYATGFGRERWNINERYRSVEFARDKWQENPVLGVGVGLREEYDATNIAWSTLAETGVVGLGAFALLHVAALSAFARMKKRVPTESVAFSLLVIGGALLLRQISHGMVDHYWGRGPLAMCWAAVGMAIWACYHAKTAQNTAEMESAI